MELMKVDDYSLLNICRELGIQDLFALSSTCTRLNGIVERELSIQTRLLIYKKAPITDWADCNKIRGETNANRNNPLHSIVIDASKFPKNFATLLNKLPKLNTITFGVYTTITSAMIEILNGKLSHQLTSISFYFPFGLHGKRLAQLNMENLTKIRIRYGGLSEPDLKVILSKCSKLEFLDVTGNWYISGNSFRSCSAPLKKLIISRCAGIDYEGMICLVEGLGHVLESLEIDFLGSPDKIEPEFFLICSNLKCLRSLKLRSSSFGGRDSSYIRWLTNLTSLTIIEVGPMMTDESLITILNSCQKITYLHLDLCYARGLVTEKSVKHIPDSLRLLDVLKLKNVKSLSNSALTNLRGLSQVHLERCGSISITVASNIAQNLHILIDPCADIQKVFIDSVLIATINKQNLYSVKAMSKEDFTIETQLPKNLKFNVSRKFE